MYYKVRHYLYGCNINPTEGLSIFPWKIIFRFGSSRSKVCWRPHNVCHTWALWKPVMPGISWFCWRHPHMWFSYSSSCLDWTKVFFLLLWLHLPPFLDGEGWVRRVYWCKIFFLKVKIPIQVLLFRLGDLHQLGHVDFYPDNGSSQPGCEFGGQRVINNKI